jgi:hypothetical protein
MLTTRPASLSARTRRARVNAYLLRRRARVVAPYAGDEPVFSLADGALRVSQPASRADECACRQRDLGDCLLCRAPLHLHFACAGYGRELWIGHRAACERALVERVRARQRGAEQAVAVLEHAGSVAGEAQP